MTSAKDNLVTATAAARRADSEPYNQKEKVKNMESSKDSSTMPGFHMCEGWQKDLFGCEQKVICCIMAHYNVQIKSISKLFSYSDLNFKICCVDGRQFVFKVNKKDDKEISEEFLSMENRAMEALGNSQALQGLFPTVMESINGEKIVTVSYTAKDSGPIVLLCRMMSFLQGKLMLHAKPITSRFLCSLGEAVGNMSQVLDTFEDPCSKKRNLEWDLKNALDGRLLLEEIENEVHREFMKQTFDEFEVEVFDRLGEFPHAIVHNDLNDQNILTQASPEKRVYVSGIVDFGDMAYTARIFELAICVSYAMFNRADPIDAGVHVIRGYCAKFPITANEANILYLCVRTRLAFSQVKSNHNLLGSRANDEYLLSSHRPAEALVKKLVKLEPNFGQVLFKWAAGHYQPPAFSNFLRICDSSQHCCGSVVETQNTVDDVKVADLSVSSYFLSTVQNVGDAEEFEKALCLSFGCDPEGDYLILGRYKEPRILYASDSYKTSVDELVPLSSERTIHIGVDLFSKTGTSVMAPMKGKVFAKQNNDQPLDYGPTIILEHATENGDVFFTLYGHLSKSSLDLKCVGENVEKGEVIGWIGNSKENGNWAPHVHFQVILDKFGDIEAQFIGVCSSNQLEFWSMVCPDPVKFLGLPSEASFNFSIDKVASCLEARKGCLSPSLSISYEKPLMIVKGNMQYLYDYRGLKYLDLVNNVCHVGHCNPSVVNAANRQMHVLNTNTRYLHESIVSYSKLLTSYFPDKLSVCFLVCTGSEANDLALRLARTYTGGTEVLIVDNAYHGNTSSLIDISPYKYEGPGGFKKKSHVHKLAMPDVIRGKYRLDGGICKDDIGKKYGQEAKNVLNEISTQGKKASCFIAESILGCGGQILLPNGYLKEVYSHVHSSGGVCIADEVQTGFGRVGSSMWAFELQGVEPDIVTLGKPIGNGHPLAAVVTTKEIALSFCNGMEYFNTFGGNPVSCEIGLAVLKEMEDRSLQEHADALGKYLMDGLKEIQQKFPGIVADVRGAGLFVGVELVTDLASLSPAVSQAAYIVNRLCEFGILVSVDGPLHNVLKLKPPMVLNIKDINTFLHVLELVMGEDPVVGNLCF